MARIDLDIDIQSEGNILETASDMRALAGDIDLVSAASRKAEKEFDDFDDTAGETGSSVKGKLGGALGSARDHFAGMVGEIPIVGNALSGLAAGPIGLAVTAVAGLAVGLATLINAEKEAAVELDNLSKTIGVSTDDTQRYQQVAKDLAIDTEALTSAQFDLNEKMGELALTGEGPAKAALESLNLSMYSLRDATPVERMRLITQRLSEVVDVGERTRLGNELLGGSYEKLAPLLDLTKEQQDELWDSSDRGIAVTEEQIERYREMDKRLDAFTTGAQTLIKRGLGVLIEALFKLIDVLDPLIRDNVVPLINEIRVLWGEIDQYVIPALQLTANILSVALSIGFKAIIAYIRTMIAIISTLVKGVNAMIGVFSRASFGLGSFFTTVNNVIGKLRELARIGGRVSNLIPGLQEGGIVPATSGGRIVRVAEGGEDEAIIPLSRLQSLIDTTGTGSNQPIQLGIELRIGTREFTDVFVETYNEAKSRGLLRL